MPAPIEIVFILDERQQINRATFGLARLLDGMIARGEYEERRWGTMPISTGNYDAEGVNRLSFPAKTVDGEAVMVVEKQTRANQSTVALADDGRIFEVVGTKLSELADDAKEEASKLFRIEYEIAESTAPVIRAEVAEASGEIRASLGEAKGEIVDSLEEAASEIKESVSDASGVVQKEVEKAVSQMKDAAAQALDNINPFDDEDDEVAEGGVAPYAEVATDPNLEGPKTKPGVEPYAKTSEAPHGEPEAELVGGIPADEQEPPVEQTPDPEEEEAKS